MFFELPLLLEETKPLVEHHYVIDHQAAAARQLETMSFSELDADWRLNEFFGTIVVINLPQAKERLERMRETLAALAVKEWEVFSAINGRKGVSENVWKKMDRNWAAIDLSTLEGQNAFDRQRKGETGCYLSHLEVVKKIKARFNVAKSDMVHLLLEGGTPEAILETLERLKKSSSVLILEDDNGFGIVGDDRRSASLKDVGRLFRKAMLELPREWDMLYFMAMSREPEELYAPHLVKLTRAILLNAYAVHHTLYDAVIAKLEKIHDPDIRHVDPVDNELGQLHRNHRCYAIVPAIAFQKEGTSSIIETTRQTYRQVQPTY